MSKLLSHGYILLTVFFTVYSQLVIRWQVSASGKLPDDTLGKIHFLATLLINPWVVTALVATFFAGISWMLAMTRFEVSYAFPFVSLSYVLIFAAGVILFNESFTPAKIIGTIIVIVGIIVIAKG